MNLRPVICIALFVCVGTVTCGWKSSSSSSKTHSSHSSYNSHKPTVSWSRTTHRPTVSWSRTTHRPIGFSSTPTKPQPSAPIFEPSHTQKYGWDVAHATTAKNVGWHTTPRPIGWNVNPATPTHTYYPAVSPIHSITYSPIPAPTVSYPKYTTTRRWFRTTRRFWTTTTTTTLRPVYVPGVQSAPPPGMYPTYPGMMAGYPGGHSPSGGNPYAFSGYPGYPTAPPGGYPGGTPYAHSQFPPFVPPYSGYGSGFGASPLAFGGYGVQKKEKSFLHSPVAAVGTVFAGLALWEVMRNRNSYEIVAAKPTKNQYHSQFVSVPANGDLVPGNLYFIVPPGSNCTFHEQVTSLYKHVNMNCTTFEPFSATVILPANATETMPCNPTRKIDSVIYTPVGEQRTKTTYECEGALSIRKTQLKPVSYQKFSDTRVYSKVYGFCNESVLHEILENITSTIGTVANSSLVDGVFVKNLTNGSYSCHVPPPHMNPLQPFSAMTFFPKTGNPYHPFGYQFPPPYLPPGYSFCNASAMDAAIALANATGANSEPTQTNSTLNSTSTRANATAVKIPILPCVPIKPTMYLSMPKSHPFYKTKYWFCNATMMALIHGQNVSTRDANATDKSSVAPANVDSTNGTTSSTLKYVTEASTTGAKEVTRGVESFAGTDWKSMCVPLPPHMYVYPADVYPYLPPYGFPYPNVQADPAMFMVYLIPPPNVQQTTKNFSAG